LPNSNIFNADIPTIFMKKQVVIILSVLLILAIAILAPTYYEKYKIKQAEELILSCNIDSDCMLINRDLGYSCCWAESCITRDYFKDNWISVNKHIFEAVQKKNCPPLNQCGPQPLCPGVIIIDTYEARCINNVCEKVGK
jgi:hypothetical protein